MRNTEQFVSAALGSILNGNEASIEVIVVDDKSTDRSRDRVLEFSDRRIRLVPGPGRGVAAAMNAGLTAANGTIIMFCDSDDGYPAGRLKQQVAWLDSHPEFDAVCGKYLTVDAAGRLVSEMRTGEAPADITAELAGGKVRTSLCTYAIRSSSVHKVGLFREFFESALDIDFQLRLGEISRVGYVPQNWYFYRLHSSSITHTQTSTLLNFYERTAYALQKQRQQFGLDDLQKGLVPLKPSDDHSRPVSARAHIQGQLIGKAWRLHGNGNKISALRLATRAVAVDPYCLEIWRSLIALIVKPTGMTEI
jgi:glycosyltransferase involved in cell wall biosynthesis